MTAQVYLIEGADGTGKTTLIEQAIDAFTLLSDPEPRFIHNTAEDRFLPGSLAAHYRAQLWDAITFRDLGISTFIDRSFLSEHIYGKLYRGETRVSERQVHSLERLARRQGIILLGMKADLAVRRERITERGEKFDSKQPFVGAFYSQHFAERASFWATADSTPAHISH